jgi:hypothetical protein
MPDLHQPPPFDQLTQRPADLIIAPQIVEISAQKHVTALARDALFQPVLQATLKGGTFSHVDNIRRNGKNIKP